MTKFSDIEVAPARHPLSILAASIMSSLMSTVITNPLEIWKLNKQYLPMVCPQYPNKCTEPSYGRNIIDCLCNPQYYRKKIFNGLSIVLPQVLFSNILFMQLYEFQKSKFLKHHWFSKHSSVSTIVSATISRLVVSTLTATMEAKRVRMSNLSDGTHIKMTAQQRLTGLKATLARDVLFSTIYWTVVEVIRNGLAGGGEYRNKLSSNWDILKDNAMPGLIGGVLASFITNPIDTVKTRIQTKSLSTNILAEIGNIYSKQGLRGLFLGWELRIAKSASHSVLYLVMFEYMLKMGSNISFRIRTSDI